MASSYVRRLKAFDSATPFDLQDRAPGVYEYEFLVEGNSILSTVFIESADVGATLLVEYYDTTTGKEVGEVYNLASHRLMSVFGDDRLTVTRIHNKPTAKCTVLGGNIKFSVYITVIESFASDLDAALQYEGDTVDINRDKGMPITAFETSTGLWGFLRTLNGKLQVDVPGVLQTTQQLINKRLYNASLAAIKDDVITHIDYTIPVGKQLYLLSGIGTSNGFAVWRMSIDNVSFMTKRNSYDDRNVELEFKSPLLLTSGQRIIITAQNKNLTSLTSEIETWLYGAEESV